MKQLALFGSPISESLSPMIHKQFASAHHIKLQYQLIECDPEGFLAQLEHFLAHGGLGGNITVPHKNTMYEYIKSVHGELMPNATISRSVNTFWIKNGQIHGDNTDGVGFEQDMLRLSVALKKKKVLVLGAGGAAAGILPFICKESPLSVTIANRNIARANDLIHLIQNHPLNASVVFNGLPLSQLNKHQETYDVIIHASANPKAFISAPLPSSILSTEGFAYDLAYQLDGKTSFQCWAKAITPDSFNGYGMLLYQAAFAFKHWFAIFPEQSVLSLLDLQHS